MIYGDNWRYFGSFANFFTISNLSKKKLHFMRFSMKVRKRICLKGLFQLSSNLSRKVFFFLFNCETNLKSYLAIAATSAAKFSSFFSIPSPVSKRTNPLIVTLAPFALATCSTYFPTACFPSSALT